MFNCCDLLFGILLSKVYKNKVHANIVTLLQDKKIKHILHAIV